MIVQRTVAGCRLNAGVHTFSWFVLPTIHVFRVPRAARAAQVSVLVAWLCFSASIRFGSQGGAPHAAQ